MKVGSSVNYEGKHAVVTALHDDGAGGHVCNVAVFMPDASLQFAQMRVPAVAPKKKDNTVDAP